MQQKNVSSSPVAAATGARRPGLLGRLRRAIAPRSRAGHAAASAPQGALRDWANGRGMSMAGSTENMLVVEGTLLGAALRIELGATKREFIQGEELRARADLGLDESISVIVMSRALKNTLEARAYGMITDTLETRLRPALTEEMRWLALYDEVGWTGVPDAFWKRYAVLASGREQAQAWVDPVLVRELLERSWPGSGEDHPFMLFLMRGKCCLRMQHDDERQRDGAHAAELFASACESAALGLVNAARGTGAPAGR